MIETDGVSCSILMLRNDLIGKRIPNIKVGLNAEEYINELNYQITTGIPPKYPIIEYCSYYVIPYQDLLLYKGTFNWASFNFNEEAIQFVIEVDEVNGTIFNNYYTNPQVSTFYKQALGYNYLTTPYKYININNTTLSS